MSINKLFIALILFSANAFADLQHELDTMEQERRLQQVERQMQDIEIQSQNEGAYKFYDDLKKEMNKTGWE